MIFTIDIQKSNSELRCRKSFKLKHGTAFSAGLHPPRVYTPTCSKLGIRRRCFRRQKLDKLNALVFDAKHLTIDARIFNEGAPVACHWGIPLASGDEKQFQGGLVFKARRLVSHSTLGRE